VLVSEAYLAWASSLSRGLHPFLHLVASHSLREDGDLLIRALYFLLVVLVLVFVDENFLQALIFDFLVMHKQVLQFLVQVRAFGAPAVFFVRHILLGFFLFLQSDALLGLQLAECGLQVGLRLLNLARNLLQLCVVLLQRVEVDLL